MSAPETLQLVNPASALLSNQTLHAPPIELAATGGLAFAGGELLDALHEEDIRARPLRLNLTLLDDAWVPTLATKYAHLLLAGLASEQAEPRGWAAVAQAALRPHHVTRVDDTHVIVPRCRPQPDYDIAAPETLRLE